MTWDKFLVRREDFIGRDIITDEDCGYCRGPLEYVVGQKNSLRLRLGWMAYSIDTKHWDLVKSGPTYLFADMNMSSVREVCDSIIIDIPYLGTFTILPEQDCLSKEECAPV